MPPNATRSSAAAAAEHDDPVREHEPVAAVRELARQVAVLGDDRRQAREPVVRGVRGEDEDRRGGELQEHEQRARCRTPAGPSCAITVRSWLGYGCEPVREHRDAEEQRAEQHAHPHERGRGVLRLGPPERGHAVRDRLDAGERDRARREALQQQEERERAADLVRRRRTASASNGTGAMSPKNDRDEAVDDRARRGRACRRTSGSRRCGPTP